MSTIQFKFQFNARNWSSEP